MPLTNHPFGFQQSTDDYLIARLIIAKKYLADGESEKAKEVIDEIIKSASK